MAENSRPFDSTDYTEAQFATMMNRMLQTGVMAGVKAMPKRTR